MHKNIWYIFITTFLIACQSSDFDKPISINPTEPSKQKVYLSDIAQDIKYIPIKYDKPFTLIYDYIELDSLLFLSIGPYVGVVKMDTKGNIIKQIGKIGRGPGEYKYGVHFSIVKNMIYILNGYNRINKYTLDGEYIRDISLKNTDETHFTGIYSLNNDLYLSKDINMGMNPLKYEWIRIDTLGNILSKKNNHISPFYSRISGIKNMYKYNNSLYYWNHYNDTIFRINNSDFKSKYLIEDNKYRLPRLDIGIGNTKNYMNLFNVFEVDNYLYLSYFFQDCYYLVYYNKKDKRTYLIDKTTDFKSIDSTFGFINNLDGGLKFYPRKYINWNNINYILGYYDPYSIKDHISSLAFKNSTPKYPEKKKELERLANSLDENDNPVLMLVKLKE